MATLIYNKIDLRTERITRYRGTLHNDKKFNPPGKHNDPVCYFAKSLQLCPTLCDPLDDSPPGFPVPGILQARTLEWVAISFSNAWKWKVKVKTLSRVQPSATPWTAAFQAPPSIGFSRQEYWSGVPLPSPYPWIHGILSYSIIYYQIWYKPWDNK